MRIKEILRKKMKFKRSTSKTGKRYKLVFGLIFGGIYFYSLAMPTFAGSLLGNATQMVNDIKGEIMGMSTAALGIGVGTGVFMQKFSMGKQDKIELGGKIRNTSIGGWTVLNGITLLTSFISGYLK